MADVLHKGLTYDEVAAKKGTSLDRKTFETRQDLDTEDLIREVEKELEEGEQPCVVLGPTHGHADPGDLDRKGIEGKKEPIKAEKPKPERILY